MDLRPAKKMGFGVMRLPLLDESDQTSIDVEQVKKMVDLFMERGFTYFDTAWMYHDFASENVVKEALVDRYPRESFTLADKLHSAFFDTPEDMERIFNTQLEKTGAGYFDYYLMHGITADRWAKHEKLGCLEWIAEKKAKGLVKHVGFSFHDKADVLEDILENNPYYHLSEERKQRIKSLFKGYKNLTGAMRQELLSLGFEITEAGKHYKIIYRGDQRYMVTVGKTPSDNRSGSNNAAIISKMML